MATHFSSAEYSARLAQAAARAQALELDAIVIGPGPDLRYLTGYHTHVLERLTVLLLTADGKASLVIPELERSTASDSSIADLAIDLITWQEDEDPYSVVRDALPAVRRYAVDDMMWAVKALALRKAIPGGEQLAAGPVHSELRVRKSPGEVGCLLAAGHAIDQVHARVPEILQVGRTEREVARDISAAILENHETADFVIVASGPNSASPHHEPTDRVIAHGDVVVVDIGGTTEIGYCSDSTRTYAMSTVTPEFAASYRVLQEAQAMAREAVVPGVGCAAIDAVARAHLEAAGLGELFVHRTGHGIGMATHEEPYIVAGNSLLLEEGMAFSIEPGFYDYGKSGARLEDIVVCGEAGAIVCNDRPRELIIVD